MRSVSTKPSDHWRKCYKWGRWQESRSWMSAPEAACSRWQPCGWAPTGLTRLTMTRKASVAQKNCDSAFSLKQVDGRSRKAVFSRLIIYPGGGSPTSFTHGVLHHTGNMWQALENVSDRVQDGG